jgi:hypothetical protein
MLGLALTNKSAVHDGAVFWSENGSVTDYFLGLSIPQNHEALLIIPAGPHVESYRKGCDFKSPHPPFTKLILTHQWARWIQGALQQSPSPSPS